MLPLVTFLLVFAAALFMGAVLAGPLYLLVSLFSEPDFADLAVTATQITGLVGALFYLKLTDRLCPVRLGLILPRHQVVRTLTKSFAAGLMIMAGLAAALWLTGIYSWHETRTFTLPAVMTLLIASLFTGLGVGLFEEVVFRGALQQGLSQKARPVVAIISISLVYAAVHFIDYQNPVDGTVRIWSGISGFMSAYANLVPPDRIDAFATLFMLGLLLGLIRLRTGHLYACIGVHAGVVAGVKIFRFGFQYQPESPLHYLVSSHDYRLGWLALIWLTVITAVYFFYKPAPKV